MGKSIIFWQSIVSPHQVFYLKHLPKLNLEIDYILVVPEVTQTSRNNLGWQRQELEGFSLVINPDNQKIKRLAQKKTAIQVFEGIRGFPLGWTAFKIASKVKDNKIIILSEVPDLRGKKRNFTRKLASFFIERRFRKNIDLVFCIGSKAIYWYKWCNYSAKKLKPFCYVVSPSKFKEKTFPKKKESVITNFLFIGSLIPLKGTQRLLQQLSRLREEFRLTIIGDGIMKNQLMSIATSLGLFNKVIFKGILPNDKVRSQLRDFDFLVLPSYYDGWGAVVNEALMEGTAVIVSDACGSSDIIINNSELGYVFNSLEDKALLLCLEKAIKNVTIFRQKKTMLMNWAHENISGRVIAEYFYSNIQSLIYDKNDNIFIEIPYKH